MRRLLLLVMIALLPLRMRAADGMAVQMAQAELAASAGMDAGAMPADCPMMAAAEAEAGSDEGNGSVAEHCFACHLSVAGAAVSVPAMPSGPGPATMPHAPTSRFASAELRLVHKPPIA